MKLQHSFLLALASIFTTIVFMNFLNTSSKIDLEIYTVANIYFIDGLHLTDEIGEHDIYFANQLELKEWLAEQTANEIEY